MEEVSHTCSALLALAAAVRGALMVEGSCQNSSSGMTDGLKRSVKLKLKPDR